MNPKYLALVLTSVFFLFIFLPIPIAIYTIIGHPLSIIIVSLTFISIVYTLGLTRIKFGDYNKNAIFAFLGPILLVASIGLIFNPSSLFSFNKITLILGIFAATYVASKFTKKGNSIFYIGSLITITWLLTIL